MSAPLTIVIRGFKQAPDGIAILWWWGAETNGTVRDAVMDTEEALKGLSPDSDIPTVLRALLSHQMKGAGLATSFSWWHCWYDDERNLEKDEAAYAAEIPIIDKMIAEHGIPTLEDRNAGVLAFTKELVDRLNWHCDWTEYINVEEVKCG